MGPINCAPNPDDKVSRIAISKIKEAAVDSAARRGFGRESFRPWVISTGSFLVLGWVVLAYFDESFRPNVDPSPFKDTQFYITRSNMF